VVRWPGGPVRWSGGPVVQWVSGAVAQSWILQVVTKKQEKNKEKRDFEAPNL